MVTDQQVRRLMKLSQTEKTLSLAAAKARRLCRWPPRRRAWTRKQPGSTGDWASFPVS